MQLDARANTELPASSCWPRRALLRSRLGANHPHTLERIVATLGVVGLLSMIFTRLGFFLLPLLGLVAITVAPVRRALRATWPKP